MKPSTKYSKFGDKFPTNSKPKPLQSFGQSSTTYTGKAKEMNKTEKMLQTTGAYIDLLQSQLKTAIEGCEKLETQVNELNEVITKLEMGDTT